MRREYKTVHQTLVALKKLILLERITLTFYCISIVYFLILFIDTYTKFMGIVNQIRSMFNLIFFVFLFTADMITITYFINMARNYVKLLEQHYYINKKLFFRMIGILTLLIVTTLFRYEIFYNIAVVISWITNDPDDMNDLI